MPLISDVLFLMGRDLAWEALEDLGFACGRSTDLWICLLTLNYSVAMAEVKHQAQTDGSVQADHIIVTRPCM